MLSNLHSELPAVSTLTTSLVTYLHVFIIKYELNAMIRHMYVGWKQKYYRYNRIREKFHSLFLLSNNVALKVDDGNR